MSQKGKYQNSRSWSLVSGMGAKQTAAKKPVKKPPQKPKKLPPKEPPRKEPELFEQERERDLTPRQRLWERVKTVLTYIVMTLSVAMMIFTAISVTAFDRNNRDIFGYKFFIVRSDSMSATDFSAGDLVVIHEADTSGLREGDIIAFISEDPNSMGETFTHKIRRIETNEYGQRSFITYGTTTGVDDLYPVSETMILGIYRFAVPNVGSFFAFMKSTPGYICCIGIPFVLMLLIQGGNSITLARQMYKEKRDEAEAEHQAKMDELTATQAAIEEQQRQMADMLQELRQLRSELNHDPPET